MILYPNAHFERVEEITNEFLQKNSIKALILDVDNTLIDYQKNISKEIINWAKNMKQHGIKLYILSNTNQEEKVKTVAKKLEVPYSHLAKKPFKNRLFKSAKKIRNKATRNRCSRRSNFYRCNWW